MRVIRVGTFTNYGWTEPERKELEAMKVLNPEDLFFVNSNGETPLHVDPGVKAVLTLNPYLDRFTPPCPDTHLHRVAWVRLKWVNQPTEAVARATKEALTWAGERNLKVVYTVMRFFSKAALRTYCADPGAAYERRDSAFWPREGPGGVLICDPIGGGCPTCGLCAILTTGTETTVAGLDLRASLPDEGHCDKNCPECWAKRRLATAWLSNFCPKTGIIRRNLKQRGHR